MEEWKTYKLGELMDIKGGKRLPKGEMLTTTKNSHPYIRIRDLGATKTLELTSSFEYVDDEVQKHISRYIVNSNDVILSIVGTIGLVAIVGNSLNNANLTENCVKFINLKGIDSNYLYYFLISPLGQDEISKGIVGAVQPKLPIKNIESISIPVPNIDLQQKIASILTSIDAKIELNRKINDNLEQQLQALYNEWFVENPKSDWHSVNLSEIATFVSGYSYKGNELVENSDTAMATIKNFERNGGFKIDGYKPIIPSPKLKVDQRAQLFDILVAHTDLTQNAEVIGNAEILLSKDIYKNLIFSMDLVKVNAKESFPFQFLLALLLKNPRFKSHCIGYVNGTTVLHMNKRALPDYETIIPNLEDAQKLNATAKAIFCQMSDNLTEISNLTQMRDTLLPRLMSGELKINDLDS